MRKMVGDHQKCLVSLKFHQLDLNQRYTYSYNANLVAQEKNQENNINTECPSVAAI